ncbi:MAG: hypothetical protein IJS07_07465, partial [Bacteroidales bacterium]|nr:hypothetical protein [Bacteroidales bacterium]
MMCFITAAACCILMAASPPQGQEGAILYLTGAQSLEELDSSVLEHFESLLSHPIRINFASRQVLESSMLLDRLQIMTLMDYRRLQGDILSAYELSLVPGFGAESAAMLAPFLDFSTSSAPGRSSMDAVSHAEACLRYRSDGLSFKGSYDWRGSLTASAGFSTSPTASLSYHAPAGALNLTAGDFNVRLGQGLCAWTGFSMSSLGNVASFSKRSGGIIPGSGYTRSGRLRGAAVNYDTGRWAFTGFLAGKSGACLSYYWSAGQAGINFFSGRLSADSRITAGRFDLF